MFQFLPTPPKDVPQIRPLKFLLAPFEEKKAEGFTFGAPLKN